MIFLKTRQNAKFRWICKIFIFFAHNYQGIAQNKISLQAKACICIQANKTHFLYSHVYLFTRDVNALVSINTGNASSSGSSSSKINFKEIKSIFINF